MVNSVHLLKIERYRFTNVILWLSQSTPNGLFERVLGHIRRVQCSVSKIFPPDWQKKKEKTAFLHPWLHEKGIIPHKTEKYQELPTIRSTGGTIPALL